MNELITVRGVTGTLAQLMEAFGVQISKSSVLQRHRPVEQGGKGWSWERALLHPGRGGRHPLRALNPNPVKPYFTPWEAAQKLVRQEVDCSMSEALIAYVAMGYSREAINARLGLMITPHHFDGLASKVAKLGALWLEVE